MTAIKISCTPAPALRAITQASPSDGVVTLGPFLHADLESLFVWLNDAHSAKLDLPYRPLDSIAFQQWLERTPQEASQILFAIRTADTARAIGFVLFRNFQPVYQVADLGVRIGAEDDRGRGYGARAVRLALDYAWKVLNLHRVGLNVLAHNQRAIASYHRAGFATEGRLREAAFIDGRWCDVVLMGALRPVPA
jgi:[ribosomal protein S5]-alanine N-acetyltransferase